MNDVQFDTDQYNYILNTKKSIFFVDFLIKKGVVKTEKQAYITILIISLIILVFSLFFILKGEGYSYVDKNSYVPAEI